MTTEESPPISLIFNVWPIEMIFPKRQSQSEDNFFEVTSKEGYMFTS